MDIDRKDAETLYDFEWRDEDVQTLVNLDEQNEKFVRFKYISLLLFIAFFLFYGINAKINLVKTQTVYEWDLTLNFITIMVAIVAYSFVHFISIGLHMWVFKGIKGKITVIRDEETFIVAGTSAQSEWRLAKQIMSLIFIPDYFWADYFKGKFDSLYCGKSNYKPIKDIETLRFLKKYYIERSNWFNFTATIFFVIFTFIFIDWNEPLGNHFIQLLILFVSMRIISRSLEIMVAFYNDVMVQREKIFIKLEKPINPYETMDIPEEMIYKPIYINSWKNSQLLGFSRASLALHSLAEIVLIFAVIYMLLSIYFGMAFSTIEPWSKRQTGEELGLVKYFLFSFTSSVSFPTLDVNYRWAIPQALQLLVSVILVVMSFAYYLGKDNNLLPHERKLFIIKKSFKPEKTRMWLLKWFGNSK